MRWKKARTRRALFEVGGQPQIWPSYNSGCWARSRASGRLAERRSRRSTAAHPPLRRLRVGHALSELAPCAHELPAGTLLGGDEPARVADADQADRARPAPPAARPRSPMPR